MQSFADLNNAVLSQIEPDLVKAAKAAKVRDAFASAIMDVCDSPQAAKYMLSHIQAVYVMRDDAPKKARGKANQILLRIYCDDSTVRAELDARQEWIRMSLARQGITYDRMRLHASSFGMRERKPFADFLCDTPQTAPTATDVERHAMTEGDIDALSSRIGNPQIADSFKAALVATASNTAPSMTQTASESSLSAKEKRIMVERLEVLKRAFCLVFGVNAQAVLEKINAAYLVPLPQKDESMRERYQSTRCVLYSADPRFAEVMAAFGDQIRGEARRLGLYIRGSIRVLPAPQSIANNQAFPSMENPQIVEIA